MDSNRKEADRCIEEIRAQIAKNIVEEFKIEYSKFNIFSKEIESWMEKLNQHYYKLNFPKAYLYDGR